MKNITSIIGGLAGAVALNLLHETARKYSSSAPSINKVGEQALSKSLSSVGIKPLSGKQNYQATLLADVISNTAYYSLIGSSKSKNIYLKGAFSGLVAGIGAITLPQPMGLDDKHVNKNTTRSLLTVGYYVFGGFVAAATISMLRKRKENSVKHKIGTAIL